MKPSKPSSVISFSASASEGTVFNAVSGELVSEYLGSLGLCVVAVVTQDQVDIDMTSDLSTQDIPVLPP